MVYFYQLFLNTDDVILKLYTSLCQRAKCTLCLEHCSKYWLCLQYMHAMNNFMLFIDFLKHELSAAVLLRAWGHVLYAHVIDYTASIKSCDHMTCPILSASEYPCSCLLDEFPVRSYSKIPSNVAMVTLCTQWGNCKW